MWALIAGFFTSVAGVFTGIFASIEKYILIGLSVLVVTGSIAFFAYYEWSQNKIQTEIANEQKLSDALQTETNAFNKLKQDTDAMAQNLKDLQTKQTAAQKKADALKKQIQNHDFDKDTLKNPDATQKAINDETQQMFKDIESLTDPDSFGE